MNDPAISDQDLLRIDTGRRKTGRTFLILSAVFTCLLAVNISFPWYTNRPISGVFLVSAIICAIAAVGFALRGIQALRRQAS